MGWRSAGKLGVDYHPTQEQIDFSREFVRQGSIGHRGKFDGSPLQQFQGILGQTMIADLFCLPRPEHSSHWDGGVDIVVGWKNVDVKTTPRANYLRPHWYLPIPATQFDNARATTEVYLFAALHTVDNVLTILGWLKKFEIDRKWYHAEGETDPRDDGTTFVFRTDTYAIPASEIRPWSSPNSFETEMTMFG